MRVCSREPSLRQTFPHVRCGSACFRRQRQPLQAVHAARLQITSTSVPRTLHAYSTPWSASIATIVGPWLPGPVAFQPVNALSKVLPFDLVQSRSCPRTFHRLFNGPLHGTYNAILVCFKRPYICTVDAKRATSHYVILFAVGTVT